MNNASGTKRRIDPEWVVATAAMVISVCALVVSILQTRIMQQQRANAVWPHLRVIYSNLDGAVFEIVNKGVGPAIVQNLEYSLDGKPMSNISQLVDKLYATDTLAKVDSNFAYVYSDIQRLVLAPNEEHLFLRVPYPEAEVLMRSKDRIHFKLCYCSIEDDCWSLDGLFASPKPGCD